MQMLKSTFYISAQDFSKTEKQQLYQHKNFSKRVLGGASERIKSTSEELRDFWVWQSLYCLK